MDFIKKNKKERLEFVDIWAKYVCNHEDKKWSKQQNIIINSCLQGANRSKEEILKEDKIKFKF
ncbi:MAG: hypothetical protein ACQER9_02105 [Nanobdellota archaeon]